MGPAATVLAKKIRLWYMANEPRPSPAPELNSDAELPLQPPSSAIPDTALAVQLSGLRAFEDPRWDGVSRDMSALLSRLSEASRQRLMESLSLISAPPPLDPMLARRWIWAVSGLLPSTYPTAIMEFFQLAWMWEQIRSVAGVELEAVLALFYRALRSVGEGPRSAAMIHFLIQFAGRWPERFCFWLDRTSEAGPDVIQALKRAEALLPEASPYARETLLDFAAELGWRFLGDDDLPLWKAVGRLGEVLFRRLRGTAIPASSLQLMAGVLGELEREGIEEMFSEVRAAVVAGMFGEHDRAVVDEALASVPETYKALEGVGEMELIMQITSLRGNFASPLKTGAGLVRLAAAAGGGRLETSTLVALLDRFEGQVSEPQILEAMELVAGLKPPIPRHPPGSWVRMLRLLGLTAGEGEPSRSFKNAVGRVFEGLAASTDSEAALEALEQALTVPGLTPADVFVAASFLLRSAQPGQTAGILSRTAQTASLLLLLGASEREKLLASLPPAWLVSLAAEETGALGMVCGAVEKLRDRTLRLRFLEKVVAPMLDELPERGGVFEEYLVAAATEYNKVGSQGALRDTENDLLQRLFRTGDRTKAIEESISRLLRMPGLEGDRAEILIDSVKLLCGAFGRLSVWQESSDSTLPGFLQRGLPRLVRTMVDFPEVLDTLGRGRMQELVDMLMPSAAGSEADPQVARWQMKTGMVFFGQVLPLTIELFPGSAKRISAFAESLCDQAVRTTQGVVAGAGYLGDVALRLEQFLIESYTQRFASSMTGANPPGPPVPLTWPPQAYDSWNQSRAAEASLVRDATQIARSITPDKKIQRLFVHEARKMWEGLSRAGLLSRPALMKMTAAQGVQMLGEAGGGSLLDVVRLLERGEGSLPESVAEKAEKFFYRRSPGPSGESPCRMWRLDSFTPLGACLVDLMMLEGARTSSVDQLTESFLEVAEFLGTETGGDELLLAFERCLSLGESGKPPASSREALKLLEKQLFRPLWRRRAMSRVELLVAGLGQREKLVDGLLERLSREAGITAQVRFLRKFGQIFLTVEDAAQALEDHRQVLHIHEMLSGVWLFGGAGEPGDSAADAAREGYEAAREVFRNLLRRAGAVTAAEAEEISVEMRRRYRDNAEVVAILLRWTLDPSREDLLRILENNPALLEAAGSDTELMHMLDSGVQDSRFLQTVESLAGNPAALKARLQEPA